MQFWEYWPWYSWVLGPPETILSAWAVGWGAPYTKKRFKAYLARPKPAKRPLAVRTRSRPPQIIHRGSSYERLIEMAKHAQADYERWNAALGLQQRELDAYVEQLTRAGSPVAAKLRHPGYTCTHCAKQVDITVNGLCMRCRSGVTVRRCVQCKKPRDASLMPDGVCAECLNRAMPRKTAMYRQITQLLNSGVITPATAEQMLASYMHPRRGKAWHEFDSGM